MKHLSFLFRSLLVGCLLITAACEGGKGKSISCSSGSATGPNNCSTPPGQCPNGQSLQNGVCKPTAPTCELGQHLENGRCVVDTLQCPSGQIENNGQCVPIPLQCPIGQHEEQGECVLNTVVCSDGEIAVNGECLPDVLTLSIEQQQACWESFTGSTRLILQYTVRDATGATVDPVINSSNEPTALSTELFVNTAPVDREALLDRSSELLKSDLVLSLVLDSSKSMLSHNPPAFAPMKNAAISILRETKDIWEANNANFHWELAWFNLRFYRPLPNNQGETWTIGDIINIQVPADSSVTGLYKAIAQMSDIHQNLYNTGVAAGPRDQHVMIVFTDGNDNNSFNDTSDSELYHTFGSYNDTLLYEGVGYQPVTFEELPAKLNSIPNLRTFIIGFSPEVNGQALLEIANAGNGRYFYGDNSNNLQTLFETVQREFVTQLTLGAEIPQQPGEYLFTLEARHLDRDISGQLSFKLNVGPGALPTCTE